VAAVASSGDEPLEPLERSEALFLSRALLSALHLGRSRERRRERKIERTTTRATASCPPRAPRVGPKSAQDDALAANCQVRLDDGRLEGAQDVVHLGVVVPERRLGVGVLGL